MGQIEVYEFLKDRRKAGDDSFISIPKMCKEIQAYKLNKQNPRGLRTAVVTLEAYGYLDVMREGKHSDFRRVFRLKDKYL